MIQLLIFLHLGCDLFIYYFVCQDSQLDSLSPALCGSARITESLLRFSRLLLLFTPWKQMNSMVS